MMDYFRLGEKLNPKPDGESAVRHRTGVVDAVNVDGTVDLDLGGVVVPSVSVLDGAVYLVGDAVQVAAWGGDLLVVGRAATSPEVPVTVGGVEVARFTATGLRGLDEEHDADIGAAASFTNTAYADLDALTPTPLASAVARTVTIGANGRALIVFSGIMGNSAGISILGFRISGATTVAAADTDACWKEVGERVTVCNAIVVGSLNPGSTDVELQARSTSGTASLRHPRLTVIPL